MSRAKYRILHVIDSFGLGGAQEVVLNLARYADRERFEIEAASMHGRGVYWQRLADAGARVHWLSPHYRCPIYVFMLAQLLLRRRYDVVHCHLTGANFIAKPVAALLGVRVLFNHDHNNEPYRDGQSFRRWLDKTTNRFSTHVIAVSTTTRDAVRALGSLPPDRVTLVHNGIDLRRFAPATQRRDAVRAQFGFSGKGKVVAGIGRFNFQKNLALFLDIAADVLRSAPDTIFALAGSGPDETALRERAKSLGIAERVRFLGNVAATEELYPAIDVLLMPSRFEGLPMVLLEAMATKTPVVASRVDGIAEIMSDGIDCLLAKPGDRADFAEKVLDLLYHPEKAARLAEAAHEKVMRDFSAERNTREIEALYLRYLEPANSCAS